MAIIFVMFIGVFMGLVCATLATWPVMISLGIIHHQMPTIPAFGFWAVFVLLSAFAIVIAMLKGLSSMSVNK